MFTNWPIKKISLKNKNYPSILKKIKNPPKILYYRGRLSQKILQKTLAIVGSRKITGYGQKVIDRFIPPLIAEEVTIISGFMYGVDSEAHINCLKYGGKTIAVFGCGLNHIYPPENKKLYLKILASGGLVLSEYQSETKPQLWTFPQRNRIISGLTTLGVLIIEAGEKSGSLITARLAKEQNKPLWAIPGPITSSVSLGTNNLIKNNQAKMALEANNILNKKSSRKNKSLETKPNLNPFEKQVYQLLEREPLTIDEIARKTKQNVIKTGEMLTFIVLRGLISEKDGKFSLSEKIN